MILHKTHRTSLRWSQYWVMGYIGLGVALFTVFVTPNGVAPSGEIVAVVAQIGVDMDVEIARLQGRLRDLQVRWLALYSARLGYQFAGVLDALNERRYYEFIGGGR